MSTQNPIQDLLARLTKVHRRLSWSSGDTFCEVRFTPYSSKARVLGSVWHVRDFVHSVPSSLVYGSTFAQNTFADHDETRKYVRSISTVLAIDSNGNPSATQERCTCDLQQLRRCSRNLSILAI